MKFLGNPGSQMIERCFFPKNQLFSKKKTSKNEFSRFCLKHFYSIPTVLTPCNFLDLRNAFFGLSGPLFGAQRVSISPMWLEDRRCKNDEIFEKISKNHFFNFFPGWCGHILVHPEHVFDHL